MITFNTNEILRQNTYGMIYIYGLCDNGVIFYIGSSKDPIARYMGYYRGDTVIEFPTGETTGREQSGGRIPGCLRSFYFRSR